MWVKTKGSRLINLRNFDDVSVEYEAVYARRYGSEGVNLLIGRYRDTDEACDVVEDLAEFIADASRMPFYEDEVVFYADRG